MDKPATIELVSWKCSCSECSPGRQWHWTCCVCQSGPHDFRTRLPFLSRQSTYHGRADGVNWHTCSELCRLELGRISPPGVIDPPVETTSPAPQPALVRLARFLQDLPPATRAWLIQLSEGRNQHPGHVLGGIADELADGDSLHLFGAAHRGRASHPAEPGLANVLDDIAILGVTRSLVEQLAHERGETVETILGELLAWYRERFSISRSERRMER